MTQMSHATPATLPVSMRLGIKVDTAITWAWNVLLAIQMLQMVQRHARPLHVSRQGFGRLWDARLGCARCEGGASHHARLMSVLPTRVVAAWPHFSLHAAHMTILSFLPSGCEQQQGSHAEQVCALVHSIGNVVGDEVVKVGI